MPRLACAALLALSLAALHPTQTTAGVFATDGPATYGRKQGMVPVGFKGISVPPVAILARLVTPDTGRAAFVAVLVAAEPANDIFAVGTNAFTLPKFLKAPPGMVVGRNGVRAGLKALRAGDIVQVVYDTRTGTPLQLVAVGPA